MFAAPKIIAFQGAQAAAGFFENQRACGIVPQFLSAVHINVVAAAGKVAPVQSAAAHAAYRAERGERVEAAGEFARTQVFDFDAGDGFVQFFADEAQRERCAVEEGAAAAFGVKTFAADGVVDNAQLRASVPDLGYGYGEMR